MTAAILWCALGLLTLVGGAEILVRGGSMLARQLGISPLVIGLTFVAIGGGRRCGFSSAAPG